METSHQPPDLLPLLGDVLLRLLLESKEGGPLELEPLHFCCQLLIPGGVVPLLLVHLIELDYFQVDVDVRLGGVVVI